MAKYRKLSTLFLSTVMAGVIVPQVALAQKSTQDYFNQAKKYYQQQQLDQALQDYNQTIQLNPNLANSEHDQGKIYYSYPDNSDSIVAIIEKVKQKKIEKKWENGNCKTENTPCFQIQISYPQFSNVNEKPLAKINATIEKEIINSIHLASNNKTLDDIVQEKFSNFNQIIERNDSFTSHWSIEVEGKQESKTENTLTILISSKSYLGGAHPNTTKNYLNFDRETGELIQLEEIILDQEKILKIAEKKFRTSYDLSPDEPLKKAGLFKNELVLPKNFAITKKGLIFLYNPYEIGPYAAGYYQFTIPWESLEGLVNRSYSSFHTDMSPAKAQSTQLTNQCESVIASAKNKIMDGREVRVSNQTFDITQEYNDYPRDRPLGVNFIVSGPAAKSIMVSEQFQANISTQIITQCQSVSLVKFGKYATDWTNRYGLIKNDQIRSFKCEKTGYFQPPRWGEQICF